ncbi:hypothetical protein BD410DRAFT_518305 [Rickenella mellea]|uniref:Dbl homology domain-containing protein n=1 Tax=Rickenella mellea TaxID=50990 RepID=A0A4Y7QFD8_9AGAM|nr:hypothetical protein BD410DRAFT_518305 [Rickenella mellea]
MASSVEFPSDDIPGTGQVYAPPQHLRPSLLPFRRISLPTPPSLLNRNSVTSLVSCDEESATDRNNMKDVQRRQKTRPISIQSNKRLGRRKDSQRVDEARESKRRKVIVEIYDTEKAYVEGLDLIYTLFLNPLVASLDTPTPLLGRAELTSVFSNFVDIWNLHHSFLTLLSSLLSPAIENPSIPLPPLSPVLVSHFPYLSLYTPFITSFPAVLSSISSFSDSNPAFGAFIRQKEADERCGKLKLRDWLLTVVQRCPRYLLLLKDLIACTDPEDVEHAPLVTVYNLLSRITNSLNTSLHAHSQTLALIALQRSTANLPFQLVVPGRILLKRGPLVQIENSSTPKPREFLLFTDCLLWLASDNMIESAWLNRSEILNQPSGQNIGFRRPDIKRSRSKSENELPTTRNTPVRKDSSPQVSPKKVHFARRNRSPVPPDEKWWFKGKAELVDLEVVVSAATGGGEEHRLEMLSPEMSFAVYAESETERDEWASAIRGAKASLLVSLNLMNPNSTLTSSSSTNHLRKTLQALPYLPDDNDSSHPKRGKVDHFVPPIWVPDGRAESCMRCGKAFGWRRRRHHCRLCGRCVCAGCSSRTFFIQDSNAKHGSKSARACNACYEAVFPLVEDADPEGDLLQSSSGSTLSSFPSWKTAQPPLQTEQPTPSALMTFKKNPGPVDAPRDDAEVAPNVRRRRMSSRPLSYPAIPLEFQDSRADSASVLTVPELSQEATDEEGIDKPPELYLNSRQQTPDSGNIPQSSETDTDLEPELNSRVRRSRKRFSMPALAIQTPQVTAQPNVTGAGRAKRYSLVLGGKGKNIYNVRQADKLIDERDVNGSELRSGVAANLHDILQRTQIAD